MEHNSQIPSPIWWPIPAAGHLHLNRGRRHDSNNGHGPGHKCCNNAGFGGRRRGGVVFAVKSEGSFRFYIIYLCCCFEYVFSIKTQTVCCCCSSRCRLYVCILCCQSCCIGSCLFKSSTKQSCQPTSQPANQPSSWPQTFPSHSDSEDHFGIRPLLMDI